MAKMYIKPSEKQLRSDGFSLVVIGVDWVPHQESYRFSKDGRLVVGLKDAATFPHKNKALVFLRRQWRRFQQTGVAKW